MPWKPLPALRYALRGMAFMLEPRNARLLLAVTVVVVAAGFWLRLAPLEWCAALAAIALVWIAETLNTAVERLTDLGYGLLLAHPERIVDGDLDRLTPHTENGALLQVNVASLLGAHGPRRLHVVLVG